mmetsp:Transcript_18137/g.31615  ORF Transcript_18137/g.31615 Transcript_18137/m.31615 type:complete len:91 (-) Transcript_18137:13-285(-)
MWSPNPKTLVSQCISAFEVNVGPNGFCLQLSKALDRGVRELKGPIEKAPQAGTGKSASSQLSPPCFSPCPTSAPAEPRTQAQLGLEGSPL